MHANGDPALALQIHRIERLVFHVAHLDRLGELEQAIGERRLAVIDVRDNAKIADVRRNFGAMRMLRA